MILFSAELRNLSLDRFPNSTFNSATAVFFYHRLCRSKQNTNSTFTCFRDLNYLCICHSEYHGVECFGYNPSSDRCSRCLSNGYCLQGEVNVRNDFLCLCPRCHHGKMCEYSTELMTFTLDSLIVKDIQNNYPVAIGVLLSVAFLIFLFGLFNNFSSFLTFIRRKTRKFGVGNYLLMISIIDQCSLLLLVFKIIHIILGTNGTLFSYKNLNLYSCKVVCYLLSVFTRLTYWLTSFVTMERLCVVLFPTSVALKNPRLAFGLSAFAMVMVCGMHVHEILYYTTIEDLSYTSANVTLCVTSYTQSLVSTYNRMNILFHYFIPFLIQTISITIMIIRTAGSRAQTSGSQRETFADIFKKQLKTQKELYITPTIIILSSLPQTILSFSYACGGLNQSWQRYTLLAAYFFSYLPQMLGFILYVLPSTAFSKEFRQTAIGKIVLRQRQLSTVRQAKTRTNVPTIVSS